MKEMKEKLECFTYGQKQDFLTLVAILERNSWNIEDYKEFMSLQKPERDVKVKLNPKERLETNRYVQKMMKWNEKGEKCPICNSPMRIFDVNTYPGNQVGGEYKTQLICENCGDELFLTMNKGQLLKKYGIV